MTSPNNNTPIIRQPWLRVLVFILFYSTCALVPALIELVFSFTSPGKGTPQGASAGIILLLCLMSLISIGAVTLFRRYIDRKTVMSMGFAWRPYQPDAFTGFFMGIALPTLATLILFATKKLAWSDVEFPAQDLFLSLVMMVLIAFGEEMVFRGYILNNLLESMNKWAALGISAVLFALAHGGNWGISTLALVNLLLGGALLGINYIYTRNLWFAVFFHFSWNFMQGPVLGYEVSGLPLHSVLHPELQGPAWLTGNPFGLEGSFVCTVVFVLGLLIFYWVYENRYGKKNGLEVTHATTKPSNK